MYSRLEIRLLVKINNIFIILAYYDKADQPKRCVAKSPRVLIGCVKMPCSRIYLFKRIIDILYHQKVQVGKDQEKSQSEKDSHSKNRGGKKPN